MQASKEAGRHAGMQAGRQAGMQAGNQAGMQPGNQAGMQPGNQAGMQAGAHGETRRVLGKIGSRRHTSNMQVACPEQPG